MTEIQVNVAAATTHLEQRSAKTIADRQTAVVAIARQVHAQPEVAFDEHFAVEQARKFLESEGFQLSDVPDFPTAFVGQIGDGGTTVAICIEYDALPGIGHACGHHLILGSSLLAAAGLAHVADEANLRILAIGTPAEEYGAGKALLLQRGVFDGVDIAMLAHPTPAGVSYDASRASSLALGRYRATFRGKGAHASVSPHLGRNAADAAVIAQVAIGLLRQQLRPVDRIGLVFESAGDVSNIIPDCSNVAFEVRSDSLDHFAEVLRRVEDCFSAGALATGTELEIVETSPLYEPLNQDPELSMAWNEAISRLGYSTEPTDVIPTPSTDMGNVSQRIRSLHPYVAIPGVTAAQHTAEFTEAGNTDAAYQVMGDSALALAWTALAMKAD